MFRLEAISGFNFSSNTQSQPLVCDHEQLQLQDFKVLDIIQHKVPMFLHSFAKSLSSWIQEVKPRDKNPVYDWCIWAFEGLSSVVANTKHVHAIFLFKSNTKMSLMQTIMSKICKLSWLTLQPLIHKRQISYIFKEGAFIVFTRFLREGFRVDERWFRAVYTFGIRVGEEWLRDKPANVLLPSITRTDKPEEMPLMSPHPACYKWACNWPQKNKYIG